MKLVESVSYELDVPICGAYSLPLRAHVPRGQLAIQFADGRIEKLPIDFEPEDDASDAFEVLEIRLSALMYPLNQKLQMWLETEDGDVIDGKIADEPAFPMCTTISVTTTTSDRQNRTWFNFAGAFTHRIHIGNAKGVPVYFDIDARMWPPAVICVASNRMHAYPLLNIDEQSIRDLWEALHLCRDEFSGYEEAYYTIVPSLSPLGI